MQPLDPRTILFNWEQGIDVPGAPLLVVLAPPSDNVQARCGRRQECSTTAQPPSRHPSLRWRRRSTRLHHESAGGPLAMRLLQSLIDICGWRVFFVNDCLPVGNAEGL
jgi:hypothetical protein